ncbi:hypothetical protein KXQ82_09440 [Mucilaginibacter sp. HMF5004]|uniref:hypothetical protein n=1 Tax=Mucilaginibacter rivuli TaxID=2857527 RepID=UPI001C5F3B96|nr:hypothetical protein [Mucilaginibacter rivuli]MBW4889940.1 hypothetical protein [Mucilaginibacter rivuli]
MYHPFTIAETLSTAWNIFKKHFVTIIVYSVVVFFILLILGVILGLLFTAQDFYIDMLVSLIVVVLQAYTTLGLYKLIFTLIDSEFYEFHISQIFPKFTMLVSYVVIEFILAALVVTYKLFLDKVTLNEMVRNIAIILGTVAGLVCVLRILFFNSFIADDDSGPFESISQSIKLTKGHIVHVLSILGIIILLIAIPAKLAQYFPPASLFIIFSYPFVNIFLAVTYRKLVYSHKDVDDLDSETI